MLEVNRRLDRAQPVDVVSTFLGAHAFPPGDVRQPLHRRSGRRDDPRGGRACASSRSATSTATRATSTVDDSAPHPRGRPGRGPGGQDPRRRVQRRSAAPSWPPSSARSSADHLNHTTDRRCSALAERGRRRRRHARASTSRSPTRGRSTPVRMLEPGMTLALATDLCPGCWVESQQLVMALAARLYGIPPRRRAARNDRGRRPRARARRPRLARAGQARRLQIWDVSAYDDARSTRSGATR